MSPLRGLGGERMFFYTDAAPTGLEKEVTFSIQMPPLRGLGRWGTVFSTQIPPLRGLGGKEAQEINGLIIQRGEDT